jgi:hypothetical protein
MISLRGQGGVEGSSGETGKGESESELSAKREVVFGCMTDVEGSPRPGQRSAIRMQMYTFVNNLDRSENSTCKQV